MKAGRMQPSYSLHADKRTVPIWLRSVLAIAAGFIVWFAAATVGNLLVRLLVPGYAEVEKAMNFSLAMLLARLVLGAGASVVAGIACAAVTPKARWPVYVFALLLLALFVPVHVSLWDKFPIWYHIVFLGSLFPLVLLGARMLGLRGGVRPDTAQGTERV